MWIGARATRRALYNPHGRAAPLAPCRGFRTFMQREETPKSFHIPSLDGVRAVSIILVYIAHAGWADRVPGGFGVTVFFFLSGFLISTLLRREFAKTGAISIRHFYMRRFLRIFPPFYCALTLSVVLLLLGLIPGSIDWTGVSWLALHAGNYAQILGVGDIPPGTAVYWSLAVEEHFYLTYPFVAWYLLRKGSRSTSALVIFGLAAAVLAWRLWLVGHGAPEPRTYLGTDTRVDSILWGCLLAMSCNPVLDPPVKVGTPVKLGLLISSLLALVFSFVYRDPAFRETYRYSLQGVALLPVFYVAVADSRWPLFRWLDWGPIRHLGVLSYMFYLVHHVMIHVVHEALPGWGAPPLAVLAFLASLALSELSYQFMEKPVARLRRRFR